MSDTVPTVIGVLCGTVFVAFALGMASEHGRSRDGADALWAFGLAALGCAIFYVTGAAP